MAAIGPLLTDRGREEVVGRERGRGGGERERFLVYMKQLHVSYFDSFSSYFLSAFCDSLCIYLDFSVTFSLSIYRQNGQQSTVRDQNKWLTKLKAFCLCEPSCNANNFDVILRYVSPFHRPRRPLGRVEV